MYCVRCGREMEENTRFCPGCGSEAGHTAPLMPAGNRVAGHVRLLGILWLAISVFRLLPGVVLLALFGHGFELPGWNAIPDFVPGLMQMIGTIFLAAGILGVIVGAGLLQRQTWARMAAIVLGVLSLPDMPFGTALGVYTLWVLLPAKSEEEYQQIAAGAGSAARSA